MSTFDFIFLHFFKKIKYSEHICEMCSELVWRQKVMAEEITSFKQVRLLVQFLKLARENLWKCWFVAHDSKYKFQWNNTRSCSLLLQTIKVHFCFEERARILTIKHSMWIRYSWLEYLIYMHTHIHTRTKLNSFVELYRCRYAREREIEGIIFWHSKNVVA